MKLSARLLRLAAGSLRNTWRESAKPTPQEWATVAEAMGLPPNRNTRKAAKLFPDDPDGLWSHYGFPDTLHKWIGGTTPETTTGDEGPSLEQLRSDAAYVWLSAELDGKTYDYGVHHGDDATDADQLEEINLPARVEEVPLLQGRPKNTYCQLTWEAPKFKSDHEHVQFRLRQLSDFSVKFETRFRGNNLGVVWVQSSGAHHDSPNAIYELRDSMRVRCLERLRGALGASGLAISEEPIQNGGFGFAVYTEEQLHALHTTLSAKALLGFAHELFSKEMDMLERTQAAKANPGLFAEFVALRENLMGPPTKKSIR